MSAKVSSTSSASDWADAMSKDEFEDMLKAIQGRHERPRVLYKSRSIKVTVYVKNSRVDFTVPWQRMDEAIDKASSLSDGTGYEQALLDKLLYTRQLFRDQIDGEKAPRGNQAGRRGIVFSLQHAAAWTYCLLDYLFSKREQLNPKIRDALLDAEAKVKSLVQGWAISYSPAEQLSLITAFLVDRCFRQERRAEGMDSPVENRTKEHNPQSYYVTFIIPRLEWVKKRLAMNPHLFDFAKAEPLRPAPNAYLREVLEVLFETEENS